MPLDSDRARRHTARTVLRRIDDDTVDHLAAVHEDPLSTERRLAELDREWDLDRTVECEAATMGLVGLALGAFVRPAFLTMPAVVGASVFLFGTLGLYPLLPIFRRAGVRTSREIQRERYAIKAMRGDFAALQAPVREEAAPSDALRSADVRH